jgi:hypothetical protein
MNLQEQYVQMNHLAFVPLSQYKPFIIYKGTKDELEMPLIMDGDLRLVNIEYKTIKYLDKIKDIEIIENYQLERFGLYGELNERLYLCYKYGKYIEPNKDLITGKEIPKDYRIYFLIESGKITEDEWKKLDT